VFPDPPRLTKGLELVPSDPALVADNLKIYRKQFEDIFIKIKWKRKELEKKLRSKRR